ncbi:MAG: hypothetical protein ACR2NU_10180, partial [Aeoliella sp.]
MTTMTSTRCFPTSICILQLLFFSTCATAAPSQIRMVWKGNPATEATLSWTTADEGSEHFVKLRAEGDKEWTTLACQQSGQFQGQLAE